MAQDVISPDAPLPGIVPDEIQTHPRWVTKGIKCDEEYGQVEELGVPSVDRSGIKRKLRFFRWLFGWKGKSTTVEKVTSENNLEVINENNQKSIELKVFPTTQPYVPYALAVSFITKMAKDMHQMQYKHKQIIKQMEFMRKEEKNDHDRKMKIIKRIFEAYHDQVVQKSKHWQDTVKALLKRNDELMEEKRILLHQANKKNETWEREKTQLLETCTQKMNFLHTHHFLTANELQEIMGDLEDVHENLKFAHDHPNIIAVSPAKMISWDLDVEIGQTVNTVAGGKKILSEQHMEGALFTLEERKQDLFKQERAINEILQSKEILQSESEPRRLNDPQEATHQLLEILVSMIHMIYCDIPAAQQRIHLLLMGNDAELCEHKPAEDDTWAKTSSHEAFCKDKTEDLQRKPVMPKTNLIYQDLKQITLDCIIKGKLPELIMADSPPPHTASGKYQEMPLILDDP